MEEFGAPPKKMWTVTVGSHCGSMELHLSQDQYGKMYLSHDDSELLYFDFEPDRSIIDPYKSVFYYIWINWEDVRIRSCWV